MRDRLTERRAQLVEEMNKGHRLVADFEARLLRTREDIARIDGAIALIDELLAQPDDTAPRPERPCGDLARNLAAASEAARVDIDEAGQTPHEE